MNKAMAIVLCAFAVPAWAHDGHEHGVPQGAADQQSWWLDLVPRAAAVQQMEIDERQGVRFIRADGLPNHATGAFPNRSNPNRISAQAYYFRVPLRPAKAGRGFFLRPHPLFRGAGEGGGLGPQTHAVFNTARRSGRVIADPSRARAPRLEPDHTPCR